MIILKNGVAAAPLRGAMVGICAQDMDIHRSYADFSYFTYKEMQGKTASF
jgi:beta-xylosidase